MGRFIITKLKEKMGSKSTKYEREQISESSVGKVIREEQKSFSPNIEKTISNSKIKTKLVSFYRHILYKIRHILYKIRIDL